MIISNRNTRGGGPGIYVCQGHNYSPVKTLNYGLVTLSAGDEGGCGWTGTWGQVNQYIIQHRKFTPFETDSCPFITLA